MSITDKLADPVFLMQVMLERQKVSEEVWEAYTARQWAERKQDEQQKIQNRTEGKTAPFDRAVSITLAELQKKWARRLKPPTQAQVVAAVADALYDVELRRKPELMLESLKRRVRTSLRRQDLLD